MDRFYSGNVSETPPLPAAAGAIGYPRSGNPGTSTPATTAGAYWYYMITEEILNVIAGAPGLTPDHLDLTQLRKALDALYMPKSASLSSSVRGAFSSLFGSATGASSLASYSIAEIVVGDGSGNKQTIGSVSGSIDMATAGAGGLDTGVVAASTWYNAFVIAKADGSKALMASLSATAPNLPSGYTKWARIGSFRTDATANKFPLGFRQYGRRVRYSVVGGSNVPTLPSMASGTSVPFWTPVAISAFVPPNASSIALSLVCGNIAGASQWFAAAPSNNYPTTYPYSTPVGFGSSNTNGIGICLSAEFNIEGPNIYWGGTANAPASLLCYGWEENL